MQATSVFICSTSYRSSRNNGSCVIFRRLNVSPNTSGCGDTKRSSESLTPFLSTNGFFTPTNSHSYQACSRSSTRNTKRSLKSLIDYYKEVLLTVSGALETLSTPLSLLPCDFLTQYWKPFFSGNTIETFSRSSTLYNSSHDVYVLHLKIAVGFLLQ